MNKKDHVILGIPFTIANLLTIANLIFGLLALLFASRGYYDFSVILLFVALLCDGLDGRVARKMKNATVFGKQLDSLADVVSFGVVPVTILFFLFPEWYVAVGGVVYVTCATLRLARFNVQKEKGFFGLPVPAAAFVLLLLILFPHVEIVFIVELLLAVLMISTFRVPKL